MSLQSIGGFMGEGFKNNTAWFEITRSVKAVMMEKSTNSSAYVLTYEYYYDYLDPVAVDASKLVYNRCEFASCLKCMPVSNALIGS